MEESGAAGRSPRCKRGKDKIMNKRFKTLISAGISAVMLIGMVQTGFAYEEISKGFNKTSNDTQETYSEIKNSSGNTASVQATEKVSGGAGKEDYDMGYRASVSLPAGYGGAGGFNFTDEISGALGDEDLVWAFSVRYSEGTEKVGVWAYGKLSDNSNLYEDDLVTFGQDSVKVNGIDTGIESVPGRWYRVAVVFNKNIGDIEVYVNGEKFTPFGGNTKTLASLNWTRIAMMPTAAESGGNREMSIDIDYLDIYKTADYTPDMQAQADYTVNTENTQIKYDEAAKTLTVPAGTKVSEVTGAVTPTDAKYTDKFGTEKDVAAAVSVCQNIWETTKREDTDEVKDGDILVVAASDAALASLEYLTINVEENNTVAQSDPFDAFEAGTEKKVGKFWNVTVNNLSGKDEVTGTFTSTEGEMTRTFDISTINGEGSAVFSVILLDAPEDVTAVFE